MRAVKTVIKTLNHNIEPKMIHLEPMRPVINDRTAKTTRTGKNEKYSILKTRLEKNASPESKRNLSLISLTDRTTKPTTQTGNILKSLIIHQKQIASQ